MQDVMPEYQNTFTSIVSRLHYNISRLHIIYASRWLYLFRAARESTASHSIEDA